MVHTSRNDQHRKVLKFKITTLAQCRTAVPRYPPPGTWWWLYAHPWSTHLVTFAFPSQLGVAPGPVISYIIMDYIFHCNILSYPKSWWPYGLYPDREEDLCDEAEAEPGLERKVFTLLLPRWFELEVHVPEDFFNMLFNLSCHVFSGVQKNNE